MFMDAKVLRKIYQRCVRNDVICRDFNLQNQGWGSTNTDVRNVALADIITSLDLPVLNDGCPTFVRPNFMTRSILDLTIVSRTVRLQGSLESDTWGSDHFLIRLTSSHAMPSRSKTLRVVHWDTFRETFCGAIEHAGPHDISSLISDSLAKATNLLTVPARCSNPNVRYLNLRAVRRRAQRQASRAQGRSDWMAYRKTNAAFRRHATRLQRLH